MTHFAGKTLHVILLLIVPFYCFSQKKVLTLEEAVLKERTDLAPKNLDQLIWLSDKDQYSYLNDETKSVEIFDASNNKSISSIKFEDIKKGFEGINEKTVSLNNIDWLDSGYLAIHSANKSYYYKPKSKKIIPLAVFPDNADNEDIHKKTYYTAFTSGNNLLIASPQGKIIKVTDNKNSAIVSGQSIARNEFGISKGTFWSPSGKYLAFYQKDESDVADYPLVNINTTPGTLKSIKYPMTGQQSEYAKVGIYNLEKNEKYFLKVEGEKDQYLTNLAWGPDEKFIYLTVLNRAQNHMWLNKYDASTGDFVKTLFEEENEKWVEPENPPYFINGTSNTFVWMSEKDGYMNLYLYDAEGNLKKKLTGNTWVTNAILGQDKSGKYLFYSCTGESPLEKHTFKVNLKNGKQTRITTISGTHESVLSPSGTYIIDDFSNTTTPREINILNTSDTKNKITLLHAIDPLADYETGKTELMEITADDGTTLFGRLIKPHNFDPSKKYPVLVYVYGGPHVQLIKNKWLAGASLWMHYMAEKGCLVFTLDNHGSENRGFAFESIIHRQLGTVEIDDQIKGVEYLKSLSYVDSTRMAVHGWSYGGFMTGSLMLRKPGTFKVGVAGGLVTDWKYYEVMYGERYMDKPEENKDGYALASLLNHADKLQGDLLLIHGTADSTVVPQHNLSLVKKFIDNEKQIDMFYYPMHPHGVRGKDRLHLMTKMLGYIEEKLK